MILYRIKLLPHLLPSWIQEKLQMLRLNDALSIQKKLKMQKHVLSSIQREEEEDWYWQSKMYEGKKSEESAGQESI